MIVNFDRDYMRLEKRFLLTGTFIIYGVFFKLALLAMIVG